MKRDGARIPLTAGVVALLCIVVAIGAGLEGRFAFTGPLFTPGVAPKPVVSYTPPPAGASTPDPQGHVNVSPAITLSLLPLIIILSVLVAAAIVLLVVYWIRHRRPRNRRLKLDDNFNEELETSDWEREADLPTLHRGLVRASDVLAAEREPRDAIVRAWLGLQEAAEDSGVSRRASETPTEFTARVFESVNADRAAAAALLRVYLRVRFRAKPATQADVEVARQAIQQLQKTWPVRTTE